MSGFPPSGIGRSYQSSSVPPDKRERVYFAQRDDGLIKIGYSKYPRARCRSLECKFGWAVTLLGCFPGRLDEEADTQLRFDYARVEGEWFSPVPELLAFIELLPPCWC